MIDMTVYRYVMYIYIYYIVYLLSIHKLRFGSCIMDIDLPFQPKTTSSITGQITKQFQNHECFAHLEVKFPYFSPAF